MASATSRETDVSSSHATTLTSSAWLDLRTEPLVLSVSAVEAPVMVRLNDLWGFAVDEVGRTVDDAYALVVTTRGWVGAVPAGVDRIARCETSFDRCTLWVDLTEPADSGRVRDIQRAYRLEPLSTWTGGTPTDPAPAITWWPVPESVMTSDEFWELYGEAKTNWGERVSLTAAAAETELTIGTVFDERLAGFGEAVFEIDDVQSLTFGGEWAEVRVSDELTRAYELPAEFRDRLFSFSYGRSPWLNLTLTYEDTTDEEETRDDWFSVLAEISLADHHDLNISYGSERGGWKCSGGVCFFEPEFEGLKVRWVARY